MKYDQKSELFCLLNDDSNYLLEDGKYGPATLEFSKKLKTFGFKSKINFWWQDFDMSFVSGSRSRCVVCIVTLIPCFVQVSSALQT